jgi:PTS system mannose-specific IIC component
MSVLQMILIALFIYLGAIGSIVGNTIGWYCLGRPLVASFIVGLIMGDVQTAMLVGVPLQIAYLANVTPGGAVAWDLSYATYIGTATAIALKGTVASNPALIGLAFTGAGLGGVVGGTMWGIHYSLDVFLNRWAERLAEAGETRKMWMPNVLGGQAIGFLARFVPALAILAAINAAGSSSGLNIPGWFITGSSTFGSMMAALGMGIILSFLVKKNIHWAIFPAGFFLVTYFGLNTMAVAIVGIIVAFIVYAAGNRQEAF